MQKKKQRISLMEKLRRAFIPFASRKNAFQNTREFKRWENGWKRHCSSRGMIRRIGSKQQAIKLGLIKA